MSTRTDVVNTEASFLSQYIASDSEFFIQQENKLINASDGGSLADIALLAEKNGFEVLDVIDFYLISFCFPGKVEVYGGLMFAVPRGFFAGCDMGEVDRIKRLLVLIVFIFSPQI
jgi:hypothetical protein